MKISKLANELQVIKDEYGDIECDLYDHTEKGKSPENPSGLAAFESFFIVPESFGELGEMEEPERLYDAVPSKSAGSRIETWRVRISSWPY